MIADEEASQTEESYAIAESKAEFIVQAFIDPIAERLLKDVKRQVEHHDRDWWLCIDGDEGVGKSVLAMQYAKHLYPDFSLENVAFNAEQFIMNAKKAKKFSCIVLDEAFSSANARAALSDVNRAIIGVSTEMRQRNLYIIVVLPSGFDLDRHLFLHRINGLIHCYFDENGNRGRYVIFPKDLLKYLYYYGKKFYSYVKPRSPYAPCRFRNQYVIDEMAYRKLKAQAFSSRVLSPMAKKHMMQRNAFVKHLHFNLKLQPEDIQQILAKYDVPNLTRDMIFKILRLDNLAQPKWK